MRLGTRVWGIGKVLVIVGALGGGLAWVLRRRRSDDRSATSELDVPERDHPTSVGR